MGKWKVRKDVILYVIEFGYLLYTGALIYWSTLQPEEGYYDTSGSSTGGNGPDYRQWAANLASFYVTPYIPLLFIPIPFSATLGIMSIFLLVLVVIIPTVKGGWNEFSDTRTLELTDYDSGWCPENKEGCILWYRFYYLGEVLLLCALSITTMIASYFAGRSNRKSFIQRKLVQALTKQREDTLVKKKEEQEALIHSIFPKAIAKNLIAKSGNQEEEGGSSSNFIRALSKRNILDSTLACMHQDITILFTDIVGFTSMSQTCLPFEVMSFLHNLFTEFDDLIEMDSDLWKVETVGDAFMVASGLGVTSSDASMRETMVDLEYRVDGRDNDNSCTCAKTKMVSIKSKKSLRAQGRDVVFDAARAAIIFGEAA